MQISTPEQLEKQIGEHSFIIFHTKNQSIVRWLDSIVVMMHAAQVANVTISRSCPTVHRPHRELHRTPACPNPGARYVLNFSKTSDIQALNFGMKYDKVVPGVPFMISCIFEKLPKRPELAPQS